jgi:O-antigen ligase
VTEQQRMAMPVGAVGGSLPRADGATLGCIFVVVLMIVPARLVFRGLPMSITPADLVGLVLLIVWLCTQLTDKLGAAKGRNAARTALFVYALAMLATFGYGTVSYLPPDELNLADHGLVIVASLLGVGLVACDGVRSIARLDFLLKAVTVVGVVVALIGALQFLGFDLTKYMVLPGLRQTLTDVAPTEGRGGLARVQATTSHAIEFGVLCAMILPLALHYASRTRRRSDRAWRWWVAVLLVAVGLFFAVSRSAVLALAGVGAVLWTGWNWRQRGAALLSGTGFLVTMKFLVPGLLGTLYGLFANAGTDDSVNYRTHDYPVAEAEIANHLWLGRGLSTWYSPKHEVFDNQVLLSLVETGVLGLAALVGLFLAGIYVVVRARFMTTDRDLRSLALALAASLVAPVIGCFTFDLWSFSDVTGLTFLVVGAAGALLRIVREAEVGEATHGSVIRRCAVTAGGTATARLAASSPQPARSEGG